MGNSTLGKCSVIDLETSGVNPADDSIIDNDTSNMTEQHLSKNIAHSCASPCLHYTMITSVIYSKAHGYYSQNAEKCPFMGRSIT